MILMIRPDEVQNCRHTGEGRYPVLADLELLDPGLRRGDDFIHLWARSIETAVDRLSLPESHMNTGLLTITAAHPIGECATYPPVRPGRSPALSSWTPACAGVTDSRFVAQDQ